MTTDAGLTGDADSIEMPATQGNPVAQLDALLRGEISAAETYRMAIEKFAGEKEALPQLAILREIQEEHGRAAQALRERILSLGGEASDTSGVWGAWAKTVQGTMNLFGDAASLRALREGEEHGLSDYQSGLDTMDAVSRQLIQDQLIPAQQKHLNSLDQLIGTVESR